MAVQMASVNRAVIGQLSAGGGATSIKLAKLALKEIPNSLKVFIFGFFFGGGGG